MVYRKDSELDVTQLSDPKLKDKRIGVVAGTPPASVIAQLGLLGNVTPYQLVTDTRIEQPAVQAMQDVASGETDVALIWGPIAGYQALQMKDALKVVPLINESKHARMAFRVSMAVRYNETEWKRRVNAALNEIKPEIDQILHAYGVPMLNDRGEVISP
jgi:ABC-type amino acid transport substrate-binding protein